MKKYFGTDGVRGLANIFPISPDFSLKLGLASSKIIHSKEKNKKNIVIIGKDSRLSSDFLESSFAAGCAAAGFEVYLLGITTTPSVSYLTQKLNASFGAMISASHNPFYDNGIKLFSPEGIKIPDSWEEEIEETIDNNTFTYAKSSKIGKIHQKFELISLYEQRIKSELSSNKYLKNLKAVIDCANGSSYRIAGSVFANIFKEVIFINDSPNGININDKCGSTHINTLIKTVKKEKADIGFAFDGDSDRILLCSSKGDIIDGDYILAILAKFMKKNGLLKNNTIVSTVMANLGFLLAMKNNNINVVTSKVGDKYVYEDMIKYDSIIGGEQSGHIIFRNIIQTGDGILTAIKILDILEKEKKSLDKLSDIFKKFPQIITNIKVSNKEDFFDNTELIGKINTLSSSLDNTSRILIRPSGTEPLIRIMVESKNEKELNLILDKAEQIIRKYMKVEE